MHNRSKAHCSPKYDVPYRSGKGSAHSHGTPVDVVPTSAGIPLNLNPLPWYYRKFQSNSMRPAHSAVMSRLGLYLVEFKAAVSDWPSPS